MFSNFSMFVFLYNSLSTVLPLESAKIKECCIFVNQNTTFNTFRQQLSLVVKTLPVALEVLGPIPDALKREMRRISIAKVP